MNHTSPQREQGNFSALFRSIERDQARRARQRAEIPVVSLVGYTNAGKSTLFNRVTSSEVYAADKLFATLDPTLARVDVEH